VDTAGCTSVGVGSSGVRAQPGSSAAWAISGRAWEAAIESGAASGAVSGDRDQPEGSGNLAAVVSLDDLEGGDTSEVDNSEGSVDLGLVLVAHE
jgi:hypothetical protein